jgi:hypothetical protein
MASPELLKGIRREFGRNHSVVTQPDHPYLISGPDALIGGNGILTSLFIPKAAERRIPTNLLVRLAASRLALPVHTRFVLLVDGDNEVLGDDYVITRSFDSILRVTLTHRAQWGELHRFVDMQGREPTQAGREMVRIQRRTFALSNALMEESQRNFQKTETPERARREPQEVLSSLRVRKPYQPKPWSFQEQSRAGQYQSLPMDEVLMTLPATTPQSISARDAIVQWEDGLVGATNLPSKRSPMEKLGRFFQAGLQSEYVLDNGVPYPVNRAPKVLFVSEPPSLRLDPLKPTRVMAFSGWVMTQADSEDPNAIIDDITQRVRGLYQ